MIPRAAQPRRRRPRGFTFVELMCGMIITALVMAALAGLLTAVGEGWTHTESTQQSSNVTAQAHLRIQRQLKSAKQIGFSRQGALDGTAADQAALLFWKSDANSDGAIQFSELAALQYSVAGDPDDPYTLRVYEVHWPAAYTAQQRIDNDTTLSDEAEILQESAFNTFMADPLVDYTVLAREIIGVEFRVTDGLTVKRPSLDYLLNFNRSGTTETEYGTVTVRTPTTYPT